MATVDRQNRSLKLCQLINDRQIDNEVGAEIRKLLIEGVDINFQDLNRNNNTPLHLATQKSDKKCIRLLLKYKPNLEIRNGNGETPFDIAQNDEIGELLSLASFDVVKKKFVREIEFQYFTVERLKFLEADPTFKVLKITSCPNVQIVWEKLNQNDFKRAINKSSHLFVIAIETQEDKIENLLAPSVDIKRPFIVQITSEVSKQSLIYYKEESSKQLIEIKINSAIDEALFNDAVNSEAVYNLDFLVEALNTNNFGTFSGSLLDVKLNNDKDRSEMVNCFAATNALCHRFFKLFDENLTEGELDARMMQTLKYPGDQSLSALLDLPFEFEEEIELTDDQRKILDFEDSRNYNMIMIAIESNNTDAIKNLLRFPIDLSHLANDNRWASDFCWEKQNWECLAELIEAGSPYPFNFEASVPFLASSTAFGKIESVMEAAEAFHESIQKEDIEAVEQFIKSNPKLKQVYDSTNKSALTVALESDEAGIFSLLLSKGFTTGVDDEYDEALKNCNFKYKIMDGNRKYFKNAFDEPHLKRLLNKYKLSFSSLNRESCSRAIQNMFLTLNEIPEMVPILQIVSCSELLKIVFDFDCHSVQEKDPTAGSSTKGIAYPHGGLIYVGAKNHREDFFKVIGTLAHELTHYAMQLTYKNSCKPYAINDEANQEIFQSIVDETRKHVQADPSTDSIISRVFTCYIQEVWHQELSVRVPHLFARYKNAAEPLEEARRKNYRLFDFFLKKVLPDVKTQTKVLMHELDIRKINSRTGTIEKIKRHEVQLKAVSAVVLEDQIIESNAPQLTLRMLRQSLGESSHVFIKIEQIVYGNIRERIGKLEKKDFAIVVDCIGMVAKYAETICNIRKMFKIGKILLVMAAKETSIVTPKLTNFKMTPIEHNWSDLTDDSQDVLLQKNVIFQGTLCSLENLINKSSVALLDLPLDTFCNSVHLHIGDRLVDPSHTLYLPRSFITRIAKDINKDTGAIAMHSNSRPRIEKRIFKSGRKNVEGLIEPEQFETFEKTLSEEILIESKEKTVVIISDSAGTGKTSTLHEIARKLRENDPTRWTLLTDLKKHIEMFKKIQEGEDFKSFQGFVTQIILADKSTFEKKLFSQFYQEGRTNILFDGFDEISPNYKKEVLKALKLFAPKSVNQLWITTRSHLELELEKTLDQLSCSLQPLTREAQIEFLENIWKSGAKSNGSDNQENLSVIAADLVRKLSSICDSKSSFISLPILISMVAEIFDDPEKRKSIQPEKLSFYSIFKQFVNKNIDISRGRGEIAEQEWKEISLQSESIVEVHRRIAIAHIFGNEIDDIDVECNDEEWTIEKLTRLGLIRYDESKESLSFIQETFAEYFLTDFIVGNLRTKARARGAVRILVKVLTEKDFQVARLFLNQALKELNIVGDKKLCGIVGKQLNAMREESLGMLLHISKECCEEVFKFMLHTIEHVEEQIRLITEKGEHGSNILQIIVIYNSKTMIQTLFDFITQNTKLEIAKITVQALDNYRANIFHSACFNKNEEIFSTIHKCMQKILTTEEIKKMMRARNVNESSVLHSAAWCGAESSLNDLFGILKEVFSDEEVKEMLFEVNKDGNNSLHIAARLNNKIALNCFFTHLNQILNHDETKKLILQRGFDHENVFHSACVNRNEEIFSTFQQFTSKFLEKPEIKKMMRERNEDEWSVLHSATAFGTESSLNDMFGILKEVFSDEEVKEMLFEVNKDGNNSLHIAARLNNKFALNCFFTHLNQILNHDETKKLILQRGYQQGNIFHSACFNKNEEIFSTIHKCMQKILITEEIKKMIRARSVNEWSVLHCAAGSGAESSLNDLLVMLKELFSDEDMKEMLFEVNENGNNSLHVVVCENNKMALKSFLEHLSEILDSGEIKKLFQQRGFVERNIFHSSCFNENDEIIPALFKYMQKILSTDEIKEMLREKEANKWSVLHYAAANSNKNAFIDLLKIIKEVFSYEEMKEIFEVEKDDDNSLHAVVHENNKNALKSFFVNLSETLNYVEPGDEQKGLIQKRVSDSPKISDEDATDQSSSSCSEDSETEDKSIVDVKLGTPKVDFVSNFKSILKSKSYTKEFLQSTDGDGWSMLHHSCKSGTFQEIQEIRNILEKHLNKEELQSMFLMKTFGFGFTPLMLAASNNDRDVLESFWALVKIHFDPATQKTFLQQKDGDKNNFLHFPLKSQAGCNFSFAMHMLKETLDATKIRSLVLSRNKFGNTIWDASGSQKTLEKHTKIVWGCMPKIFDDKILKEIVLEVLTSETTTKDVKRCILFHSDGILSFILKHFNEEEKNKINYERFLIEEPQNRSIDDLKRVIEEINNQTAVESRATTDAKYFLNRNDKNQTVFHFAALNEDPEVVRFLISNAKRVLQAEEFSDVLKVEDETQQNILFKALMNANTISLLSIFKIIEENLPSEGFEELLSTVDKSGQTLLHCACSRKEYIAKTNVDKPLNVVEIISELIEMHLRGKEKLKDILLQRDQKGKSALFYATYEDHKFLEAKLFHGIVTDEELNELLNQDDLFA